MTRRTSKAALDAWYDAHPLVFGRPVAIPPPEYTAFIACDFSGYSKQWRLDSVRIARWLRLDGHAPVLP